jgi:ADP-ribose pyrophosphatase YjhB (NUDIX family)
MNKGAPFNVFQPGLIRGSNKMPFDPTKAYFYVEHPKEGWRVYLRSACFIHERPTGEELDIKRFLVVKKRGSALADKAWEPPKGQMEGKDGLRDPKKSILSLLKENVKREVAEESRVRQVSHLNHTGVVFQGREDDYPPNTYFQYHVFNAVVSKAEWMRASAELEWCREHPLAFDRMKRDKKEKDMIQWYVPSEHKMMGRWSGSIVAMYLKHMLY